MHPVTPSPMKPVGQGLHVIFPLIAVQVVWKSHPPFATGEVHDLSTAEQLAPVQPALHLHVLGALHLPCTQGLVQTGVQLYEEVVFMQV